MNIEQTINAAYPLPADPDAISELEASRIVAQRGQLRHQLRMQEIKAMSERSLETSWRNWVKSWRTKQ